MRAGCLFVAPEVLDGAHTRLMQAFAGGHPFLDWVGLEVRECFCCLESSASQVQRGDQVEEVLASSKEAAVVVTD